MRRPRRFYIALSVKGSYLGNNRWSRYVWPKLFDTEEEAWAFGQANDVFRNLQATAHRGRIVSWSVKSVPDNRVRG